MALYANMISSAHINDNLGIRQQFVVLVLNLAFIAMMLFPLMALVAVLFWRILQLWMAIALSPVLVLKHVFDGLLKDV